MRNVGLEKVPGWSVGFNRTKKPRKLEILGFQRVVASRWKEEMMPIVLASIYLWPNRSSAMKVDDRSDEVDEDVQDDAPKTYLAGCRWRSS